MNILIVCQHYFPEQFRINDISEELIKKGHKVTVLTGKPNYPDGKIKPGYLFKRSKEQINGVDVIRCSIIPRKKNKAFMLLNYLSFVVTGSFKSILLSEKFDVVYVYQLNPVTMGVPAILLKKMKRIPVHLYCLDIWPEAVSSRGMDETSIIFKIAYWLSKKVYGGVDSISVTSKLFINYFNEYFPNIKNIKYIPQHAEDIFSPQIVESRKSDVFTFCFAGNIGNLQSVETIIKAVSIMRKSTSDLFKVLIVGDGVSRKNCEDMSIKLGLTDYISFIGNRPLSEMPTYYESADAMLLTLIDNERIAYTLPGKTQSYMAMKKPIVAAIGGEAKLVIEEAGCGLVSPAEDEYLLAENMIKCSKMEHKTLESIGENGFIYYKANFTKNSFILKTINELKKIESVN